MFARCIVSRGSEGPFLVRCTDWEKGMLEDMGYSVDDEEITYDILIAKNEQMKKQRREAKEMKTREDYYVVDYCGEKCVTFCTGARALEIGGVKTQFLDGLKLVRHEVVPRPIFGLSGSGMRPIEEMIEKCVKYLNEKNK